MSYFSVTLKSRLATKGLTPYRLCKLLGDEINPDYLYKLCRGEVPSPRDDTLQKIASVPELDVTLTELQLWAVVDRVGIENLPKAAEILKAEAERINFTEAPGQS